MAEFSLFIAEGTRRKRRMDAGYQNIPEDDGNWTGGKQGDGIQAGTNMSISAKVLSDWVGHPVTAQEMQDLTTAEAIDIYFDNYWSPIRGNEINNQKIANFLADMKSSGGGVWNMQKALNNLGYPVEVDGSVGNQTLNAMNDQIDKSVSKLNNAFRDTQKEFYQTRSKCPLFCKVWVGSMDKDYPQMNETAEKMGVPDWLNNNWFIIVGAGILLIIIILIIWLVIRRKT